jgi:type II secretory pathway predicted ATPase ExeA/cytoskeletal protein CcmA (bactofilin family)
MDGGVESIITEQMTISGSVECQGRVVVEGVLEGSFAGVELCIGATGRISGEIRANSIDCAGHMEGSVVTEALVLRSSARHIGTVETSRLSVEQGAVLDCALQSGGGEISTTEKGTGGVVALPAIDLGNLLHSYEEGSRPCCMDVPWSQRLDLYGQLLNLLEKGKPLIKVTGDVGSGKSVLVEKLRRSLPSSCLVMRMRDQRGSVAAILLEVADQLELGGTRELSQQVLLEAVKMALVERARRGQQVLLLIDDAQEMFPASLEGVVHHLTGALSAGKREEQLQLILLGNQELHGKLVANIVEYFEDETNCQLQLDPLNIKDTADYLRFCLQLAAAGAEGYSTALLPYDTIRRIHSRSHGNIAEINKLATRALRSAHAAGATEISSRYL